MTSPSLCLSPSRWMCPSSGSNAKHLKKSRTSIWSPVQAKLPLLSCNPFILLPPLRSKTHLVILASGYWCLQVPSLKSAKALGTLGVDGQCRSPRTATSWRGGWSSATRLLRLSSSACLPAALISIAPKIAPSLCSFPRSLPSQFLHRPGSHPGQAPGGSAAAGFRCSNPCLGRASCRCAACRTTLPRSGWASCSAGSSACTHPAARAAPGPQGPRPACMQLHR